LEGFADVLTVAQGRMAGVRADAEQAHSSLARATAEGSDPGGLREAWDDQVTTAAALRAQVVEAAQRAAVSIRAAGRSSPTAGRGWLADHWEGGQRWLSRRLDDLKDYVAEHAGVLRTLAKVLRGVGMALVAVGAVAAAVSFVAGLFTAFAGGLVVRFGGKVLDKLAPELAGKLRRWIDDIITPAPSREGADRRAGPRRRQAFAGEGRGHRPRPGR